MCSQSNWVRGPTGGGGGGGLGVGRAPNLTQSCRYSVLVKIKTHEFVTHTLGGSLPAYKTDLFYSYFHLPAIIQYTYITAHI